MEKFRWTMQRFRENEPICVLHTGNLPGDAAAERELWQSLGVRSLLLVPLTLHAAPLGSIGFTMEQGEKTWTGENIRLLRMLAQHIVNVVARLNAEEAWMDSEERYRGLVENLNDVVFALDASGYFTYLSPGVEELSGYPVGELLGQPFSRFVHPLERDRVADDWSRVLQGRAGSFECRMLTREGSIKQFRVSGRNVYLGTEVTGVTGIMTDISQRKQAEEALEQSEERYRKLWEDSTDGLVLIDAETGGIIDCNHEFARMAGRTKEQLCTMKIWDIRPEGIRDAARRKFLEIREKGTGGSAELDLQIPDGTQLRIDFKSSLLTLGDAKVIQSRCRRVP
jgi:PAS domain S-box-containing protein